MKIHIVIRVESRSNESTAGKEEEMITVEHPRETISIIEEGLIVLLAKKWNTDATMGIITTDFGIIPIISGAPYNPSKLRRKRNLLVRKRDRIWRH